MEKSYWFISDVHLGLQHKEAEKKKERLLVSFLEKAQTECCELYILGDLFDYWFEYKRVYQKGFFRTLTALQDLTEKGVKLKYFIGNHDFSHKNFFRDEIGAELLEDPVIAELEGKKFFLGHGDGMVENDTGYNILKKILRNKTLQKAYSLIHPDLGIWLASSASRSSRDYTTKKDYGELDGLYKAACNLIDNGMDYVILGHLHQRICQNYKNGVYINLGTWLDKPCYGSFKNNKFEIIDLD
ncbi:MAG TPA: UDP-2,3-diacylglucosamine diphosphatase [Ignavibacteriales bacterium]|nr:UDP-2,3-diacylglucosamine diphosphatase [Ignavibacteriales bacterium]